LGSEPGQVAERRFVITNQGGIVWQASNDATNMKPNEPIEGTHSNVPQPVEQFESYKYPFIKWRAKPLPKGGFVQLDTTFDDHNARFIATLFKVPKIPRSITIEFLDANGFDLFAVQISKDRFQQVPGTELFQAKGLMMEGWLGIDERKYQRAREYTVK
ncbi:MAG: hypothetical protein K2X29_14935, partial [Candidatus Obscuribacterales bacterium]|nr:hypothetical protein [Candidatus Obscuribacterales bacterium]